MNHKIRLRGGVKQKALHIMLDDKQNFPDYNSGGLCCPKCGVLESTKPDTINIRGFKVHHSNKWWSHCLVCETWF